MNINTIDTNIQQNEKINKTIEKINDDIIRSLGVPKDLLIKNN